MGVEDRGRLRLRVSGIQGNVFISGTEEWILRGKVVGALNAFAYFMAPHPFPGSFTTCAGLYTVANKIIKTARCHLFFCLSRFFRSLEYTAFG